MGIERDPHVRAEFTQASTAFASVAPVYVVVMTRIAPPRATTSLSSSSKVTTPLQMTNAQIRSTCVVLCSSASSCEPIDGCFGH